MSSWAASWRCWCGSVAGWILDRRVTSASGRATVANINARIRAWWVMALLFLVAVTAGTARVDRALRPDLVSGAPRVRDPGADQASDHRALFWSFFVVTPVQYYLIWRSGTACSAS